MAKSGRRLGTNYHLDSFRPWKAHRGVEQDFGALPKAGVRVVRIVGDLFLPRDDYSGELADDSLFRRVTRICRDTGTKILSLCWNIVPDALARKHPMVAADGTEYARGNWYIFNFRDPQLREVAIKISENTAERLAQATDVIEYYQPSNEWLLAAYSPYGWNWKWYAGDSRRGERQLLSYDAHAVAGWHTYLAGLPHVWREKILRETGAESLDAVEPVRRAENKVFSPVYLAWSRYNSSSFGTFFAELYERVKPKAGDLKIVSQAYMPFMTGAPGFPASSYGHDLEFWLDQGRCFDYLGVNTYQNYSGIPEAPYLFDGDLPFNCHYSAYREIVRMYGLDGFITTECGANTYFLSEDAQRYTVLRSLLQAAAYGNGETITHLLWNDDPQFEATHEQFFGAIRNKHALPKPSFRELALVSTALEHSSRAGEDAPFAYVVFSRMDMDVRFSEGPVDFLAAREMDFRVITDHVFVGNELSAHSRAVLVADAAATSSTAFIEKLALQEFPIVIPATIGRYGVDEDAPRENAALALLRLPSRRFEESAGAMTVRLVGDLGDLPAGTTIDVGTVSIRAVIAEDELPERATVLARFGDGAVALYRLGTRLVSAFGLGRETDHDYGRTLLCRAVAREIGGESGTLRRIRNDDPDSRLLVYDLGDVVAVVNTTYQDATARILLGGDLLDIPVVAHRASMFGYQTESPFIVVTGGGTVRQGGDILIEDVPPDTTVVVADGSVDVRPYYSKGGGRIVSVRTKTGDTTVPLEYEIDHQGGHFRGAAQLPMTLQVETERRVEARADLRRRYPLRFEASGERQLIEWAEPFSDTIDVTVVPDRVTLEWDEVPPGQHGELAIEAFRHGRWEGVCALELSFEAPRGSRETTFAPDESTRYRYRFVLRDAEGKAVRTDAPGRIALCFDFVDRALPVMVYGVDDVAYDVRILHPMEYERCRILRCSATAQSQGDARDLAVYIGELGQHIRHVLHSEDWQEVLW